MPDDPFVSTAWLAERLDAPDIRIVDASWYLPAEARDPKAEYAAVHIPGASFFDIDSVADHDTALPHMLPHPFQFAEAAAQLHLGDGAKTVIYDGWGVRSAARVWWTLRVMGLADVTVLDGGLPKWISEGRPVTDLPPPPRGGDLTLQPTPDLVRDRNQVARVLQSGEAQVVDARPAARFRGDVPEPRVGLRAGHMPGAVNVPMSDLITPGGTMKPRDELAEVFAKAGVDIDKPIITSCGSGITACVLALGLARLGRWRTAVYDGSWAEWGQIEDCPVVTG